MNQTIVMGWRVVRAAPDYAVRDGCDGERRLRAITAAAVRDSRDGVFDGLIGRLAAAP
jgi:hypothetical protein